VSKTIILAISLITLSTTVFAAPVDSIAFPNLLTGAKTPQGTLKTYQVKPGIEYVYVQPPNSRYYNFLVKNYPDYFRVTFRRDKIPYIGALVAGTALLFAVDQQIIDGAQHMGDHLGLTHTEHQKSLVHWSIKLGGKAVNIPLNFPQDAETGMYFLGDGILHSSIAMGLWGYGKIWHDERAIQTGTQLIEAILSIGVTEQLLKHTCGREDPNSATRPGGKWTFFPNPVEYQYHTPRYDAMPSGHIATAMATVTVIADNYPEKRWIRPVGYSLMGVLMYAMLNNGVHWASDFPLGISIGYTFAKICDGRAMTIFGNRDVEGKSGAKDLIKSTELRPFIGNGALGLNMTWKF
jgi:hypothetical protein